MFKIKKRSEKEIKKMEKKRKLYKKFRFLREYFYRKISLEEILNNPYNKKEEYLKGIINILGLYMGFWIVDIITSKNGPFQNILSSIAFNGIIVFLIVLGYLIFVIKKYKQILNIFALNVFSTKLNKDFEENIKNDEDLDRRYLDSLFFYNQSLMKLSLNLSFSFISYFVLKSIGFLYMIELMTLIVLINIFIIVANGDLYWIYYRTFRESLHFNHKIKYIHELKTLRINTPKQDADDDFNKFIKESLKKAKENKGKENDEKYKGFNPYRDFPEYFEENEKIDFEKEFEGYEDFLNKMENDVEKMFKNEE